MLPIEKKLPRTYLATFIVILFAIKTTIISAWDFSTQAPNTLNPETCLSPVNLKPHLHPKRWNNGPQLNLLSIWISVAIKPVTVAEDIF